MQTLNNFPKVFFAFATCVAVVIPACSSRTKNSFEGECLCILQGDNGFKVSFERTRISFASAEYERAVIIERNSEKRRYDLPIDGGAAGDLFVSKVFDGEKFRFIQFEDNLGQFWFDVEFFEAYRIENHEKVSLGVKYKREFRNYSIAISIEDFVKMEGSLSEQDIFAVSVLAKDIRVEKLGKLTGRSGELNLRLNEESPPLSEEK